MTATETFCNCWTCDSRYNYLCVIHGSLQDRELMAPTNCPDWRQKRAIASNICFNILPLPNVKPCQKHQQF